MYKVILSLFPGHTHRHIVKYKSTQRPPVVSFVPWGHRRKAFGAHQNYVHERGPFLTKP